MADMMTFSYRAPVRKKKVTKAKAALKPPNHRARWTQDDDLELVSSFGRGLSASELAKSLGRTKYAAIGRLHTLGLLSFDKDTLTYYTKPQHYYRVKPKAKA
jgi:hypothetical protein